MQNASEKWEVKNEWKMNQLDIIAKSGIKVHIYPEQQWTWNKPWAAGNRLQLQYSAVAILIFLTELY